MARNKVLKPHFNNSVICRLQLPVKTASQYYRIKDKYENESIYKNKKFNVAAYMRYHAKRRGLEHTFSSVPKLNQKVLNKQHYPIIQPKQYVWELVISLRRALCVPENYSRMLSRTVDKNIRNLFKSYGSFGLDINHFSAVHANERNLHVHVLVWQDQKNPKVRIKEGEHHSSTTLVHKDNISMFKNAIYQDLQSPFNSALSLLYGLSDIDGNIDGIQVERDLFLEMLKDLFFNQVNRGTALARAENLIAKYGYKISPAQLMYLADSIMNDIKEDMNYTKSKTPTKRQYDQISKEKQLSLLEQLKDPSINLEAIVVPKEFEEKLMKDKQFLKDNDLDPKDAIDVVGREIPIELDKEQDNTLNKEDIFSQLQKQMEKSEIQKNIQTQKKDKVKDKVVEKKPEKVIAETPKQKKEIQKQQVVEKAKDKIIDKKVEKTKEKVIDEIVVPKEPTKPKFVKRSDTIDKNKTQIDEKIKDVDDETNTKDLSVEAKEKKEVKRETKQEVKQEYKNKEKELKKEQDKKQKSERGMGS